MPNVSPYIDSKEFVFYLWDGAGLQDLSASIIDHDFPSEWKINDVTTYGKNGTTWAPSIEQSTFSLTMLWNQVASIGSQTVVGKIHYGQKMANATYTAVSFQCYPAGIGGGNLKITGNCWIPKYEFIGKVGDRQTVKVDFKVDGVLTFATV